MTRSINHIYKGVADWMRLCLVEGAYTSLEILSKDLYEYSRWSKYSGVV